MKAERIFKQWQKSLKSWSAEFRKEWQHCRRTGEVESIHRLRVVLRRLRVGLRLGNRWLGKEQVAAFRQWSQKVTQALGPVRDVDITLEWLATQQPPNEQLINTLQERRAKLWQQARRKMNRMAQAPCRLKESRQSRARMARKLARRYLRTLGDDRREILGLPPQLDTRDTEHWHELRRDLRRIRYLREMALSGKERKRDALLKSLLALQELLGNAQNCVAAVGVLRGLPAAAGAAELAQRLEQEQRRWLAEAQKSLAAFQKSRLVRDLED